ncbi:MAG: TolC family protein [Blastocatellia bacterium]
MRMIGMTFLRQPRTGRKFPALLLSLLLLQSGQPFVVRAQTTGEGLTLPLAVDIALKSNPMARATNIGREIADAHLAEAKAGRWPSLQVSENFMRSNNPVFVFGSLLEQGRFTAQNFDLQSLNNPDSLSNFRTSLNFKMPVFDQRQAATRIAQAQIGQRQADTQTVQVQQQLRFEVLRAFYGVLLAQARKEVADEAVKLAEADVKRSRDRYETGLSVISDLLASEVQLADFRQQQIAADGDIITAVAALNTALGLPVSTPQKVSGALLEKTFAVASEDELMRLALENRPDFARAGLVQRERTEQVKGARGELLPRVDVFTSVGVSSRNLTSGSSDYLVGASVTFNLFDAGRSARISQARAAQSLAATEQESLASQIRFEVVRAHQQFISARERLAVASRIISHATEALRIVQDRYHEGLTTITEVLRAETALVQARMNVLAARYDHYIGYASVLLSSGQLNDVQPFVS